MSSANSLLQEANIQLQAGENLQAAVLLERLRAASPDNEMVRGKLITAYLRASVKAAYKSAAEAEQLLQNALRVDSHNESVQISYIKFLRRIGRHEEANSRQHEFLTSVPAKPETKYLLAKIAYDARDYVGAVDLLEQILTNEPDSESAKSLLLPACYRAGYRNHPRVELERLNQSRPACFADGLARIAKTIGVEPYTGDGLLPDRRNWTEAQRYGWGRRVDTLIRDQILGGAAALADVQRHTESFSLPQALQDGGAVVMLLHVGSIHLSFAKIVESKIPFSHVTNSVHLGVAFPDRILDTIAIPPNTLLTRMALALRRRACVTVAVDGPLGQRADGFEHLGVEYSIAAGPLVLAQTMRARTYLLVAGYEERNMSFRLVEGPEVTTPLQELQEFWGNAIRSEVARITKYGPENYIQHASSPIKAVTISPYKPT